MDKLLKVKCMCKTNRLSTVSPAIHFQDRRISYEAYSSMGIVASLGYQSYLASTVSTAKTCCTPMSNMVHKVSFSNSLLMMLLLGGHSVPFGLPNTTDFDSVLLALPSGLYSPSGVNSKQSS